LGFAQDLLTYSGQVSSLELNLNNEQESDAVKRTLEQSLGEGWRVKTRKENNELIYKIFRSEKWFTFAILSLVLVISSFNIFGSLIMLVLDKKKDIGILKSMGSSESVIRKVFLWQGSYIAVIGGGIGVLLAVLLVVLQQQFGFITMDNGIVDEYPVALIPRDIILTLATVSVLGYLISIYPARKAAKTEIVNIN
jgi:lipoprotein-releasing system permease protein